ncbi:MAG: type III polyketide synthase, partial [Ignavibacteriaceae bacterium]
MLIDIATANPPFKVLQEKAAEELKKRMAVQPVTARLIDIASSHSGIDTRFIVVPDAETEAMKKFYSVEGNYVNPGTQARMDEYEKWAKELSKEAVRKILNENNFSAKNIHRLITISCTGFFAPGMDYYLIEEFNIPRSVKRTNIGFMGCAASIIGFNSVIEAMNSANGNTVNTLLVSLELCSLHLQTEATRDNILANMIFADGCAAALFSNAGEYQNKSTFTLMATESILFDNSSQFMGWKIGNTGFEMILSSELPKIILNEAVPSLLCMLEKHGLNRNSIKHWALHPGGRAILDSLKDGLGLSEEEMLPSRTVLKNYGNMSSASILYVLKEIIDSKKVKPGEICCAVAFGPG